MAAPSLPRLRTYPGERANRGRSHVRTAALQRVAVYGARRRQSVPPVRTAVRRAGSAGRHREPRGGRTVILAYTCSKRSWLLRRCAAGKRPLAPWGWALRRCMGGSELLQVYCRITPPQMDSVIRSHPVAPACRILSRRHKIHVI